MQCDLKNIATNQVRQLFTSQPADTRRKSNDMMTSKRSRFDVAIMLLLRRVPVGQAYMAKLNFLFLCK